MTVLRQNITIGICISNPTSKCGYPLKIVYGNAKLCFINIVHIGLPESTFSSHGKESLCQKSCLWEWQILSNTTKFCKKKKKKFQELCQSDAISLDSEVN